jgi:GH25 family lysozyme M1 (1,4-beta-N-acetylmuramidase)
VIEGIDVSNNQGAIDWSQAAAGLGFAILKATEGTTFVDPYYMANLRGAGGRDVVFGAYHYARPDLGNSPIDEADFFIRVLRAGALLPDLVVLDVEVDPCPRGWCEAFGARVDSMTGYRLGLYSDFDWLQRHPLNPQLATTSYLWLAWPDSNGPMPTPAPWSAVSIQQYGEGPQAGIGGPVDRNRFFGSQSELMKLGGPMIDFAQLSAQVGDIHTAICTNNDASPTIKDVVERTFNDQGDRHTEYLDLVQRVEALGGQVSPPDLQPIRDLVQGLGAHLGYQPPA